MSFSVKQWEAETAPARDDLEQVFEKEALEARSWSNGPNDKYSPHSHSYHKVLYCVEGAITFHVEDEDIILAPGDRLEIPPGTTHAATVGPTGVTCLEAARY